MKVSVLGVGLIGGSIGLAARERLGAAVTGFDPDRAVLERGLEIGALDSAAGSVADAVAKADLVFCAAPVARLPELVAAALRDSSAETAVTDVGSTKRELVAAISRGPDASRFVGGHPLAGAETAGVESARAALIEGARWYLTPTGRSEGVVYDRVHRAIADLGARPQAIEPEIHDRIMATVSHLPHVLANALVAQASSALAEASERLPEVGPSFRDTTRVAGANPAVWNDIFAANGAAVADEIEALVERLREAARMLRATDAEEIARWHAEAAEHRRRLLEAELVGGPLHELRVGVENRPGTVAELALALGRAGVNIEDMALYPTPDMRAGAVSLWVAGREEARRATEVVRGLGHAVSVATGGG